MSTSKQPHERRLWPWVVALVVGAIAVAVIFVTPLVVPKRVLCIGDSLTSGAAQAVTGHLQAKGFEPEVHAIPGSGLLDTKVNWADQARQVLAQFNPDVVVVEFIGDYGLLGERPGVAANSPQFFAQWASAAQQLEDILTSGGAQVYWVLGPPVAQPVGEHELVSLDYIYQALRAPNTTFGRPLTIDAVRPFSAHGAGYSEFLPNPNGLPVQIRTPDGTHLTVAGDLLFAQTVANAVASGPSRPFWRL
jgi:hypothetical protein